MVLELFRDMDSMIEFWISATFAVVIAVFVAGARLGRGIRRMILWLYLAASLLAALRWTMILRRTLAYRARLAAEGHANIPTDVWLLVPVNLLITAMFVGGATATVYFLSQPGNTDVTRATGSGET